MCCASCGSRELQEIIDLGMHPFADTFVPVERRYESERSYPLICDLCAACAQIQLRAVTDPTERYSRFDYSYTSSNSDFSRRHWINYAAEVTARLNVPRSAQVVEIGSNDGFLAERLNQLGLRTLGVDASPAMCELASRRGVQTRMALFSSALGRELINRLDRPPLLIVANNVINHADDPLDFAKGVKLLLSQDGTFVFELPYFLRTITEGKFDQIYHEHISYFTVKFARNLFRLAGMQVVRAEEVDYHGGSIRVFVRHDGDADESVQRLIGQEEDAGLFDPKCYAAFMERIRAKRDVFMRRVFELRSAGERLVCVGAAAKANTFMNYYNLDASIVDWVTDASPNKIGKLTPGTRIPIVADDIVARYGRVYAIITSWNLAEGLRTSLKVLNPQLEFLNPYESN